MPNRCLKHFTTRAHGQDSSNWTFADKDSTRGIQTTEDSLGFFWRPEVLGSAFSGDKTEEYLKMHRPRKDSKASATSNMSPFVGDLKGVSVPDAGPEGAQKLVMKALKLAHYRDGRF